MTAAVDAGRARRKDFQSVGSGVGHEGTVIGVGMPSEAVAGTTRAPKRRPETAPLDAKEIMKKGLLKDIAKELKAWTGQVFSIKEAAAKIAF